MESFLMVLLVIAMAATLLVLFVGIGVFAAGGEANKKYGNKLMRMRVLVQGLAVILFALVMILAGK